MEKRHTFAVATFVSLYILCLTFSTGIWTTYITALFSGTAIFISLFLQVYMFQRVSAPFKNFILLFIVGTGSYLVAEATWTFQVLFLSNNSPIPSISDIFYDINTISYILGFVYLAYVTNQRLQFINFLLDVTIIYKTMVVLLTSYLFLPYFIANGFLPIEITMATLYPALVMLLNISIVICYFDKHFILPKKSMLIFFTAALTQLIGDSLFAVSYYQSSFASGSLLDPLWSLTIILYGYGVYSLNATSSNHLSNRSEVIPSYLSFKSSVYRMLLQSLCILLLAYFVLKDGNLVLQLSLILTIILVLIRQILSSLHIHKLLKRVSTLKDELELKVKQRTEQLSKKNDELLHAFDQINYMAFHDDLTGLPNRRALYEKLETCNRHQQPFTLLFIDIDKFKTINDTYGHMFGDDVLVEFSKKLTEAVYNRKNLFRQAGDEFIIILEGTSDNIEEVIMRIDIVSKVPLVINNNEIALKFSIGIAHYPTDTTDISEIIKIADNEMYKVKKVFEKRS